MPLNVPTTIPPIGEQTDPDKVRVVAVIGGQLASAPARGFGLTPDELLMIQGMTAITPGAGGVADFSSPVRANAWRNRVVNPAFQHSQELGTGGTVTAGAYFADQWMYDFVGPVVAAYQAASFVSPNGSPKRGAFNVTTGKASLAAGDFGVMTTRLEGIRVADFQWGTASAKRAILSFVARIPVAGTYTVAIRNGAANRSYIGTYAIAAGEINTDVTRTIVIPGDTTGTWLKDNTLGLSITFSFACGTTLTGVAGWQAGNFLGVAGMANAANAVQQSYIADVGLYLDADAKGVAPRWEIPDEAAELVACMRYWQKAYLGFFAAATSGFNMTAYASVQVPPRTNVPTLSGVNIANFSFPATVGSGTLYSVATNTLSEVRQANATAVNASFSTTWTINARM